jgi:hypothetical protein
MCGEDASKPSSLIIQFIHGHGEILNAQHETTCCSILAMNNSETAF